MIFTPDHIEDILAGRKTMTRRVCKQFESLRFDPNPVWNAAVRGCGRVKWEVGKTYAVQPGRGKPAVTRIRITAIRQERLQDISPDDVWLEGVRCDIDHGPFDIGLNVWEYDLETYRRIWDSINTRPGTLWADNPLVWVLTFEAVR